MERHLPFERGEEHGPAPLPQIETQLVHDVWREGIEPAALVEKMVRQYHPLAASSGDNELGGNTLGQLYGHLLGTVSFEPSDLAEPDEEYLTKSGFGGDIGSYIPR